MKPETVLKLDLNENLTPQTVKAACDSWIRSYEKLMADDLSLEDICPMLIARTQLACRLMLEKLEGRELTAQEEAQLDGDFPLGNAFDAEFATPYFSQEQLARIHCGDSHMIVTGHFVEPAYDVLVRKGILAELEGQWQEAEHCYGGVPLSLSVTRREAYCREKKIAEGLRAYAEAQKYMEKGEWKEIYPLLSRASEMDNSDAITDMGLGYLYGIMGFPHYTDTGVKLLRQAADLYKNSRACMALVELHDGGSLEVDGWEAMRYCKTAAEAGEAKALARMEDGFDLRPVEDILQERAESGNADALWMLYCHYQKAGDSRAAEAWLQRALEAGQVDALLEAAKTDDPSLKERYLRQAAEKGSVTAIRRLSQMELLDGDECFWTEASRQAEDGYSSDPARKERHKRQFAWQRMAAEAGDTDAMCNLSAAYLLGYPVETDESLSFHWAQQAADAGDPVGFCYAAIHLEHAYGTEKDIDKAIGYYARAAEQGIMDAMLRLYEIYRDGLEHIPADKEKASRYLWMSGIGHS